MFGTTPNKAPQDNPAAAAGATALGGTALATSVPILRGRTTLYHGTTTENANKILENGLRPNAAPGIAKILPKEVGATNLAYMATQRPKAQGYANQADYISHLIRENRHLPAEETIKLYGSHSGHRRAATYHRGGQVLEASVPLWKHQSSGNLAVNPEAAYHRARGYSGAAYSGDQAFRHGVDASSFKGSKHYKGVTFKELVEHAKARPGTVLGGAALGLAGIGGLAYGGKKLYDHFHRPQEKAAFWSGFEKRAGNPLVGSMPGIKSGINHQGGRLPAAKPTSGVSIAARSTAPALPTPRPVSPTHKMNPTTPPAAAPKVSMPSMGGQGVSSTTI